MQKRKAKKNINAVLVVVYIIMIAGVFSMCGAETITYESFGRRDPFVPLVGVGESSLGGGVASILTIDDVALQGILVGAGGEKTAIINGELMKEGDLTGRVYIETITSGSVTLRINDAEYEVKLYE